MLRRVIFSAMSITPLDYLTFRVMRRYFLSPFFLLAEREAHTGGEQAKTHYQIGWLMLTFRGGGEEVLYIHEAFIRLI